MRPRILDLLLWQQIIRTLHGRDDRVTSQQPRSTEPVLHWLKAENGTDWAPAVLPQAVLYGSPAVHRRNLVRGNARN